MSGHKLLAKKAQANDSSHKNPSVSQGKSWRRVVAFAWPRGGDSSQLTAFKYEDQRKVAARRFYSTYGRQVIAKFWNSSFACFEEATSRNVMATTRRQLLELHVHRFSADYFNNLIYFSFILLLEINYFLGKLSPK